MSSKMPMTYLHYFGNESPIRLLEAYGVIRRRQLDEPNEIASTNLCPTCAEPNTPDAKFCHKCQFKLSRRLEEKYRPQILARGDKGYKMWRAVTLTTGRIDASHIDFGLKAITDAASEFLRLEYPDGGLLASPKLLLRHIPCLELSPCQNCMPTPVILVSLDLSRKGPRRV